MNPIKLIVGREPTLWIAVLNAVVLFVGTFGLHWITGDQAVLIVAAINAIFGVINALAVRPIPPAVFTYAVGAILAVFASYGLSLTPDQVVGLNALVIPILALITRNQVGPLETAVSKA